jgi:hypothetical protein
MECRDCGKKLGGNNVTGWCEKCGRRHYCKTCLRYFREPIGGRCGECLKISRDAHRAAITHKQVNGYVTPPHIKRRMAVYMRRAKKGLYLFEGYERFRKDDG